MGATFKVSFGREPGPNSVFEFSKIEWFSGLGGPIGDFEGCPSIYGSRSNLSKHYFTHSAILSLRMVLFIFYDQMRDLLVS